MVLTDRIRQALTGYADPDNASFVRKLTPGLDADSVLGARFPDLKKVYKTLGEDEKKAFLAELPHRYFEENNLHSIIISHIKDEEECISEIEAFLPYIDNWSTCDTISPAVFKRHKDKLTPKIYEWIRSDRVYTVRVGVSLLMRFYLNEDFRPEYNDAVAGIVSDEYYVNMMCAWYFATALAKQYEATVPYISERRLTPEVHRMTIRKAVESYRVPDDRKAYLKSFR